MGIELVLRFIGGILAGAVMSEFGLGLVDTSETPLRATLLVFSLAAAAFAFGFTVTPYVTTVNVRQPEGQPTGQGGTGTPGLDITFAGSAPKLSGLTVQPASRSTLSRKQP